MCNTPLVSIIVPVYNVEKYVDQCLESLLRQSYANLEIILVDDGSKDNSGVLCDEYSAKDPRIKVIHKKNQGLGMARNSGMDIARGKYIGFVDSDDYVSTGMFEELVQNAERNHADASYCDKRRFYDGEVIITENNPEKTVKVYRENEMKQYLLDRIGTQPKCKRDTSYQTAVWLGIYRREIIEKHHIRFLSERDFISEDIIYNIDFIQHCHCIVHSNQKLYFYRLNQNSLTTTYKADRFQKNVQLYQELCRKLHRIYTEEEFRNSVDRYLITYARIASMQEVMHQKTLGKKNVEEHLIAICSDETYRKVLRRYPYSKLPFAYSLLCFLQDRRWVRGIVFILDVKARRS